MKERNLIIKKEDMLIIGGKKSKKRKLKKSKKRKLKKSKKKRRKSYKKAKGREERKKQVAYLLDKAFKNISFKNDQPNDVPIDVLEHIAELIELEIDLFQDALNFIFKTSIDNNNNNVDIYNILLNKNYRELGVDVLKILVEYYDDLKNNNKKDNAFENMKKKLSNKSLFNQERIDSLSDPNDNS